MTNPPPSPDGRTEGTRAGEALRPRLPGNWRSMDSAPKDGTLILGWVVHRYANSAGDDDYRAPVIAHWIDHNGGGWTWHGMMGHFTHWQPLPPPPES